MLGPSARKEEFVWVVAMKVEEEEISLRNFDKGIGTIRAFLGKSCLYQIEEIGELGQ